MATLTDAAGTKWTHPAAWYEKKRSGHPNLWKWLLSWIEERKPGHIVEVGGGDGFLAKYADKYTGIELNDSLYPEIEASLPKHAEMVYADWMRMDVGTLIHDNCKPSVLIALAVAEHCYPLETFLDQILAAGPRYAIVSFFSGLDRKKDRINAETRKRNKYGGRLWVNKYSVGTIWRWARANGIEHKCYPMTIQRQKPKQREAVVCLDLSETQDAGFHVSEDLLPV